MQATESEFVAVVTPAVVAVTFAVVVETLAVVMVSRAVADSEWPRVMAVAVMVMTLPVADHDLVLVMTAAAVEGEGPLGSASDEQLLMQTAARQARACAEAAVPVDLGLLLLSNAALAVAVAKGMFLPYERAEIPETEAVKLVLLLHWAGKALLMKDAWVWL